MLYFSHHCLYPLYITQNDVEVPLWWYTDNIDVLIHVKTGGTFTQSDNTTGTPTDGGVWLWIREYGDSFNHGFVDLSGGRSPIGLDTAADAANTTAQATVAAYGIGALVAGKVAAKVGLLATILLFLKKFWILLIFGAGAFVKKLFNRRKKDEIVEDIVIGENVDNEDTESKH